MILSAEGVGVSYGGRRVLDAVDFGLAVGEVVAVLGPNGAGKSTLIRALAGLARPSAGAVRLDGEPIGTMSRRDVARKLAFVPQFPVCDLGFTALETVLMGRAPHASGLGLATATDLRLARDAMRALEVDRLEHRVLATLSGGERQRVMLARALAQEPRVLLLDEPTAYLDLRYQAASLDLVRARSRTEGTAVAFVVHDPGLAGSYADRVVLLASGRVRAAGEARAVVTEAILADVYGVDVRVAWVEGETALVAPIPPRSRGI